MGKLRSILSWIKDRIKAKDIFNHKICLTHNGSDRYSSFVGGCSFILVVIFLAIYGGLLFMSMFRRREVTANVNVFKGDLKDNGAYGYTSKAGSLAEGIKLTDGPYIAVNFTPSISSYLFGSDGSDLVPASEAFNVSAYYENIDLDTSGAGSASTTTLNFETCNEDNFPNIFKLGNTINHYKCLNLKGLELQGDSLNTKRKVIRFQVDINANKNGIEIDVRDHDTLNKYIYGARLMLIIDNKFFDFKNIEEPVQNYFQYETFDIPDSFHKVRVDLKVRKNTFTKRDGFFPWSVEEEGEFHSIEKTSDTIMSNVAPIPADWDIETFGILSGTISLDYEQTFYERRVTDLLEVTGQLGGIFELYEIIGGFIIGWISSRALNNEIYENLEKAEKVYKSQVTILEELKKKAQEEQSSSEQELRDSNSEEDSSPEDEKQCEGGKERMNFQAKESAKCKLFKNLIFMLIKQSNQMIRQGVCLHRSWAAWVCINRLLNSYNYALDSTNLSFSIRELKNKVDYLLSKDNDYQEAMKKDPPNTINKPSLQNPPPHKTPPLFPSSTPHSSSSPLNILSQYKASLRPPPRSQLRNIQNRVKKDGLRSPSVYAVEQSPISKEI
ncbi:unnamed protein product [Moneuplotes crassus]|uniref:Uncharacterized protein n=1 Tax=Euplotes crassus TaxID=5936 RepID=A0AAD2DAG7_EUPCR|nr:unnamed protein product [Moneuplotes crassus]